MLDQRAVGVERPFEVGDGHPVDARPCREVDGAGVGRVQADDAAGGLDDVSGSLAGRQTVAAREPGAALGDVDLRTRGAYDAQ